jgi:fibronectin type 3 domain-containing protein
MPYHRTVLAKALVPVLVIAAVVGFVLWFHHSPQPHRVTLTWQPPPPKAGITVVGYNIYRRTGQGTPFVKIADHVADPHYEDMVVVSGQTYIYAVTSVDQFGRESRFSEVARAKIP